MAGQWLLKGNGYRLKLKLPTDEHGMPFSRYTPVQQLRFEDPYYQPPVTNRVMTLASSVPDQSGRIADQF
ncbi:MAG: hypothetical protein U5L02_16805 [Rheinheimera sp.]|nr:hypothetical protein [Rheinheimera sp.]